MLRYPGRTWLPFTKILSLFYIYLFGIHFSLYAQKRDQYIDDPAKWPTASQPVSYGFIVSGLYPFVGTTNSDNYEYRSQLYYCFQAYYDTWMFGYTHKTYGDIFSLIFRSVGRDVYSGWNIEYGKQPVRQKLTDTSEYRFSRTLYGLGWRYIKGYDTTTKFQISTAISGGFATTTDSIPDVSTYIAWEFGAGARVPIGISGLSLGILGSVTILPDPYAIHDASNLNFEIGMYTSLGLNFTGN